MSERESSFFAELKRRNVIRMAGLYLFGERLAFAVESDIAKTIADTLPAKLSGSEKAAMSKEPTPNPEAHRLYLKGARQWCAISAA